MTRLNIPPSTTSLINSAEAEMRTLATILGRSWAMPGMLPRAKEAARSISLIAKELQVHIGQFEADAKRQARASNIERKTA